MSDAAIRLADVLEGPREGFLSLWNTTDIEAYFSAYGEARWGYWYDLTRDHLADFRHYVHTGDLVSAYMVIRSLLEEEIALKLDGTPTPALSLMTAELYRAIELVSRADCFLKTLDREKTALGLAQACRNDIRTLLVLADWCDDNGKPQSATEARHLHSLLRSYLE